MRQEERNPFDLNNPPGYGDRYREGKQQVEESSTTSPEDTHGNRQRKKKSTGGKEGGNHEGEKVYECRFCSLKFCKSQALGGHMNRHRQERETETLNRARQLVYSNEGLAGQGGLSHLGCYTQTIPSGNFQQRSVMGDPSLPLRTVYTRLPSPSSSSLPQPYMYPRPSSSRFLSFPSSYPASMTDQSFIGHVVPNHSHHPTDQNYPASEQNYTCMGAPIAHGFTPEGVRAPAMAGSTRGRCWLSRVDEGNVNCSYTDDQGQDPCSTNRFRD